jgi:hypothetical protein
MLALLNVIVSVVDHADDNAFTSQTIRCMTDVQDKLVNTYSSGEAYPTQSGLINYPETSANIDLDAGKGYARSFLKSIDKKSWAEVLNTSCGTNTALAYTADMIVAEVLEFRQGMLEGIGVYPSMLLAKATAVGSSRSTLLERLG